MDIYVGNLAFQLTEAELQNLFQEFGEIKSVKLISDKVTGKSKGFGFVTMDDDGQAQAAIEKLNGMALSGRNIVVNEARPKSETSDRGGYGGANHRSGGNRYGGGGGGNRNNSRGGYGGGGGYRDRGGNDHRSGGGDQQRDQQYE